MSAESLQSSAIAACLRISRLLTRRKTIIHSKMLMCLSFFSIEILFVLIVHIIKQKTNIESKTRDTEK